MSNLSIKPNVSDPILQKWINEAHAWINSQPARRVGPPGPPSNLRVTPGPGMNQLTFTGGRDAESHIVLISPTTNWDPTNVRNHIIDVGRSTTLPHVTGVPAQTNYYWVVAIRNGLKSDPPTGPVKGTTLALGTALTPPPIQRISPGNVVRTPSGKPTIALPGLTRGGRQP